MNVYFACSITGGRQDQDVYQAIASALLADGNQVPTALLAGPEVVVMEEIVEPVEVYTRDIAWIDACDALVAEVSTPSHGVGYEISYALQRGKPVLCCYHRDVKVSKMITGNTHQNIHLASYVTPDEAVELVRQFIESVADGRG